jgi:hypothetical protein
MFFLGMGIVNPNEKILEILNEYYVFCQVLSLVVSGLIVAANVPMLSQ